jgi:quercetin dioxygenase-like cupin family protein
VTSVEPRFAELGLVPERWESGPGAPFEVHSHPRRKFLTCRDGSITFTLHPSGEVVELRRGDWIELARGQEHSALAGPDGVVCAEAFGD